MLYIRIESKQGKIGNIIRTSVEKTLGKGKTCTEKEMAGNRNYRFNIGKARSQKQSTVQYKRLRNQKPLKFSKRKPDDLEETCNSIENLIKKQEQKKHMVIV